MSKVPKELIDEATKRGIVPGAQMRNQYGTWVFVGPLGMDCGYLCDLGMEEHNIVNATDEWATVITPAAIGLQEGDAVECGPAMRAAIIELAKELGLGVWKDTDDFQPPRYCLYWNSGEAHLAPRYPSVYGTKLHTPEDFIAKMRVTASQPKPITIDNYIVYFTKGEIKVGCTTISNETVRAIAAKLIDR